MGARRLPGGVTFAIIASVFIFTGIVYVYYIFPFVSVGPKQPIAFSHRLHVNVKQLDCQFCHNTVERSRFAGLPPVEKCLYCHEHIIPEHEQILRIKEYAANNVPIPWRKVTYLPDHVYFSHQRHIKAGVSCTECHGNVEQMDRLREVYTDGLDRMMLQGSPFKMGMCLECHHKPEDLNTKVVNYPGAKTTAELIHEFSTVEAGQGVLERAPVDCWTCHQ